MYVCVCPGRGRQEKKKRRKILMFLEGSLTYKWNSALEKSTCAMIANEKVSEGERQKFGDVGVMEVKLWNL